MFEARVHAVLAERPPLSVKDLSVNGVDVIAALVRAGRLPKGSKGGPEVGAILRGVLERVLEHPQLDRDAQLQTIGALLATEPTAALTEFDGFHGKHDGETVMPPCDG
jgi:hypothetical protein